jgi:hypothetical protein
LLVLHLEAIGTATADAPAAIVILTAAAPNVITAVTANVVVTVSYGFAIPTELAPALLLVQQAVLRQDLQKISQAAVPVVCAIIYMPQLPAVAPVLEIQYAEYHFGRILAAHASVWPHFVAKAQNIAIIIPLAIKAVAAQHLVAITTAAAPCKNVLKAIGNRAMAVLVVLTTVLPMVGKWNGVGKAVACTHLVSDVAVK